MTFFTKHFSLTNPQQKTSMTTYQLSTSIFTLPTLIFTLSTLIITLTSTLLPAFSLHERLQSANKGDYIVTAIDNTYTMLIIKDKDPKIMSVEEITIPSSRLNNEDPNWIGWKQWVINGAPAHTAWVYYTIDRDSGRITNYYSYTKKSWCDLNTAQNFLSKLLSLNMDLIQESDRKRIGARGPKSSNEKRPIWNPKLIYEGKAIPNVAFDAWRTHWPKDNTDLSNQVIIVYLPKESEKYPSYFPYWLEIHGTLCKAKVRIIDSGRDLSSPKLSPKN